MNAYKTFEAAEQHAKSCAARWGERWVVTLINNFHVGMQGCIPGQVIAVYWHHLDGTTGANFVPLQP